MKVGVKESELGKRNMSGGKKLGGRLSELVV